MQTEGSSFSRQVLLLLNVTWWSVIWILPVPCRPSGFEEGPFGDWHVWFPDEFPSLVSTHCILAWHPSVLWPEPGGKEYREMCLSYIYAIKLMTWIKKEAVIVKPHTVYKWVYKLCAWVIPRGGRRFLYKGSGNLCQCLPQQSLKWPALAPWTWHRELKSLWNEWWHLATDNDRLDGVQIKICVFSVCLAIYLSNHSSWAEWWCHLEVVSP